MSKPSRPFLYVALVSIVLTLVTAALIWKGSEQVLRLRTPSFPTKSGIASREIGEAAVENLMPPIMGYERPGMEPMDATLNDKSIMPPFLAPGAGPDDRERVGQKIIRNGSLTMRVDDVAKRLQEARTIAEQQGGFVASANMSDRAGIKTAYLTLRIPTDKYRITADALKQLASVVFHESESGQDVTDQFVDLEARLKAAKAEEAQYLEILKSARSIEDTLNVTARLGEVRSRIEQMEGQMRNLEDRTSYATLTVTMTEEARVEAPTLVWKPGETFREATRALIESLQALADALIAFAVFFVGLILPILAVLSLAAWMLRSLWRRLFKK